MASITMTSSILGFPAVTNRSSVASQRRRLVVVNAVRAVEGEKMIKYDNNKEGSNGRRDLMFAAAAAAAAADINAALKIGAHGVMLGRAAYHNPWHILGNVDSAIYGVPSIGLTRRQVLEKYQVYGDSVLLQYGFRPTVRDIVKPLLGFFHSEPGNGLWKRKADSAVQTCTTVKSFLEETLVAIPDSVLDSSFAKSPPGRGDLFANIGSLLPPPYRTRDEDDV